jgi:lactate dehydrogenase-like 2-hydroxyacid dehydrogenase
MLKIVTTQDLLLSDSHKTRLRALWDLTEYYSAPSSAEEYLERVLWADIILSEELFMHENLYNLKNCFLTFPFSGFMQKIDVEILKKNNVIASSAKWWNKYAVSERCTQAIAFLTRFTKWIQGGTITINIADLASLQVTWVYGLRILILWKGNIWEQTGKVCEALWWHVEYFTRWDNLAEKIVWKNVIINCLSAKDENIWLLSYDLLSKNTTPFHYITIVPQSIHDIDWIIRLLQEWKIIWYADDCMSIPSGDRSHEYFKKVSTLSWNTFITPHIARASKSAISYSNDIIVSNVEAYVKWAPQNLIY